jgi:predicted transcriptional regulator
MNSRLAMHPHLALILRTVAAAKTCWIKYEGKNGSVTERTITPTRVLFTKDGWVVEATCHLREAFRTIRLDGIQIVSEKAPEKMYCVGQRIRRDAEDYILALVGRDTVCAICLGDGNRYEEPVRVKDIRRITSAEIQKIAGEAFTLIS